MNLLKKPVVAVCLLAAVVCTTTYTKGTSQISEKASDVKSEFFYSCSSGTKTIFERLEARSDAANGTVTIANNYPNVSAETQALKFAQTEMANTIEQYKWIPISEYYDRNEELDVAYQALTQALSQESVSEDDRSKLDYYTTNFNGAQKMIEKSTYNQEVSEFFAKYGSSPFLKFVDNYDMPGYYASSSADATEG